MAGFQGIQNTGHFLNRLHVQGLMPDKCPSHSSAGLCLGLGSCRTGAGSTSLWLIACHHFQSSQGAELHSFVFLVDKSESGCGPPCRAPGRTRETWAGGTEWLTVVITRALMGKAFDSSHGDLVYWLTSIVYPKFCKPQNQNGKLCPESGFKTSIHRKADRNFTICLHEVNISLLLMRYLFGRKTKTSPAYPCNIVNLFMKPVVDEMR